jgi:hypothetical protein
MQAGDIGGKGYEKQLQPTLPLVAGSLILAKIGSNGTHELVRIASCDLAGRLALGDQLPRHCEEELALPAHQFTQIVRGGLGTLYLIQNLIELRAFAPEAYQFRKQQSEALP